MKKYSEEWVQEQIRIGREFIKSPYDIDDENIDYYTDQELKKPQPPLYKAPMGGTITKLPRNFKDLDLENDILAVIYNRKSSRVYTEESMNLLELSYLLYASQGVKSIRGKSYASLRTVACGGARHEFEVYLAIRNVEGLKKGFYHYLPENHSIECLCELDNMEEDISNSLCEQQWAKKAAFICYYSIIPYRAEWRYGIWAHRTALIDSGHITQNLYIACSSLKNVGTCAIAAVRESISNRMFQLDGNDEYIFYAAPVGKINPENKKEEDSFYQFVKDENL